MLKVFKQVNLMYDTNKLRKKEMEKADIIVVYYATSRSSSYRNSDGAFYYRRLLNITWGLVVIS